MTSSSYNQAGNVSHSPARSYVESYTADSQSFHEPEVGDRKSVVPDYPLPEVRFGQRTSWEDQESECRSRPNPIRLWPVPSPDEPLDLSMKTCHNQEHVTSSDQIHPIGHSNDPYFFRSCLKDFDSAYWKIFKQFTDFKNSTYFDYLRSIWVSRLFNPSNLPNFERFPSQLDLQPNGPPRCDDLKPIDSNKRTQTLLTRHSNKITSSTKRCSTSTNKLSHMQDKDAVTGQTEPDVHSTTGDSNKPVRRPYTEAELSAAVRAICFGRLGTRRAASVYGIPRSTLRNKICKLNELKKREEERLGGKSIVLSEFLLNLIGQNQSSMSNLNKSMVGDRLGKQCGIFDQSLFGNQTDKEMNRSSGYMIHTASRVASIFQVNCRRTYNSRKLHDSKRLNPPTGQHKLVNQVTNSKLILHNKISKALRNSIQKYNNNSSISTTIIDKSELGENSRPKFNQRDGFPEKRTDMLCDNSRSRPSNTKATLIKPQMRNPSGIPFGMGQRLACSLRQCDSEPRIPNEMNL